MLDAQTISPAVLGGTGRKDSKLAGTTTRGNAIAAYVEMAGHAFV